MSQSSRGNFLALAGGAAAALVTCTPVDAKVDAMRDADVSKLYAAAKKEGTVVWWTAHYAQSAADRIRDAFKAKYPGIEVVFIRQTAQVIFQRLNQDLKSNVKELDVFASTDESHYVTLKSQNVLAPFVPADINKVPASLRHLDPDEAYQIGALGLRPYQLQHEGSAATSLAAARRSEVEESGLAQDIRLSAATSAIGSWP